MRAKGVYTIGFVLLYSVLAIAGPTISLQLGAKYFPREAWSLAVALLMAHISPTANIKWLNFIEDSWRRWVHSWFLVPDGIIKTVGVLEDAKYSPPEEQLELLPDGLQDVVRKNLEQPATTLRARWGRAQMLMESLLRRVGDFSNTAFGPFQEDFQDLRLKYLSLKRDIQPHVTDGASPDGEDGREEIEGKLSEFLKQVYRYISWGVLYGAKNERDVDHRLENIGFTIPTRGGRRTFDMVAPPAFAVAGITLIFWLAVRNPSLHAAPGEEMFARVIGAVTSAVANGLMYGLVGYAALHLRSRQIEQRTWREGSARCLVGIAFLSGLIAYLTIVFVSVLSIAVPVWMQYGFARRASADIDWRAVGSQGFLGAVSWPVVGVAAGILIARSVGQRVRNTLWRDRANDGVQFAAVLASAVGLAALLQAATTHYLNSDSANAGAFDEHAVLISSSLIALAGAVCGGVLGVMVPYAFRSNLARPLDYEQSRARADFVERATRMLGSDEAAESWVFAPRPELFGLTPAEATRYSGYTADIMKALKASVPRRGAARASTTERV